MKHRILRANKYEFNLFQDFIERKIGIKFPETKKSLLESRLSNHIARLGLGSFEEYYHLLQNGTQAEYDFFIDKITTHTTHFFRENFHFDFILNHGTKILNKHFRNNSLKALSLGASTGEEMYTLAMVLNFLKKNNQINDFTIHGADISKQALLKAKTGIFKIDHLESIPKKYRYNFYIKEEIIEAKLDLKKHLHYYMLNACKRYQQFPAKYHIIFCRNMLIYFSRDLQQNVIDNIQNILLPGGLCFIGHSESLHNLSHKMKRIVPTVYQGVTHD